MRSVLLACCALLVFEVSVHLEVFPCVGFAGRRVPAGEHATVHHHDHFRCRLLERMALVVQQVVRTVHVHSTRWQHEWRQAEESHTSIRNGDQGGGGNGWWWWHQNHQHQHPCQQLHHGGANAAASDQHCVDLHLCCGMARSRNEPVSVGLVNATVHDTRTCCRYVVFCGCGFDFAARQQHAFPF